MSRVTFEVKVNYFGVIWTMAGGDDKNVQTQPSLSTTGIMGNSKSLLIFSLRSGWCGNHPRPVVTVEVCLVSTLFASSTLGKNWCADHVVLVGLGGPQPRPQPAFRPALLWLLGCYLWLISCRVRLSGREIFIILRQEILIFQLVMGRFARSVGRSTISQSFSCNWTHFHSREEQ